MGLLRKIFGRVLVASLQELDNSEAKEVANYFHSGLRAEIHECFVLKKMSKGLIRGHL
jgi:hypothetical protein